MPPTMSRRWPGSASVFDQSIHSVKAMFSRKLHCGDRVIFSVTRHGTHPHVRAKDIRPAPHGEEYVYAVDKFWIVTERRERLVVVRTRRGKVHCIEADDPRLRLAPLWQRLIYRSRFPTSSGCSTH
jgi:hypothetical protein